MLLLTAATSRRRMPLPNFSEQAYPVMHIIRHTPSGRTCALRAMEAALSDACISPADIDYIHLHAQEQLTISCRGQGHSCTLWRPTCPFRVLSERGNRTFPGAAEQSAPVISALSITHGIIPANTGCHDPIRIKPERR